MAEVKESKAGKTGKEKEKQSLQEKKKPQAEEKNEVLVRIYGYDIPGSKNIYTGLTRIKGISWSLSNAVCIKLNFPRTKKVEELSKEEINKIEEYLSKIDVPDFMKNRRNDPETGKTTHLYSTDLDIARDFDIKRMKKIKSYKGIRHSLGQPVRGQRTRSHFRKTGKVVGVKKSKEKK